MKWLFALVTATLLGIGGSALAAFGIFQTYAVPVVPQIFYNIVTDGGANCAGPPTVVSRTFDINHTTKVLTTTVNTFAPGDVGKAILLPEAGFSTQTWTTTIASYTDAQNVVLASTFKTVTASTQTVTFGFDTAPAFAAFNTWARANQGSNNQVVLTIPAGSDCWFGTNQAITDAKPNMWAAFIKNLIVEGAGATINSVDGAGFSLGGLGTCFQGLTATPGCTARVQTVSAGSSTITLTAASYSAGYISRFAVGNTILIGGVDPQALFSPDSGYGDPVNLWAFEWRKITAICNNTGACPGSAVITLDAPVDDYYSDQWPQYNPGDQFRSDSGGPATIWKMHDSWETTVEYRGLTISQGGQTYARGRNITYRDVVFTGALGGIPTENESFSAINTDYGITNMETDKLVGTMLFDGVTINKVVNQSTATKRLIIRNSAFTGSLGTLDGGAQYTEISDTTIKSWNPGIWAYGSLGLGNYTTCTRCTIDNLSISFGASSQAGQAYWTMSGGVITMPNAAATSYDPGQRYFVPGALVYMSASGTNPPISFSCCETIGSFQVTTITSDPWPALDNQTLTTTINTTSGSKNLNVPSGPFVPGDVGKTIIIDFSGSRNVTWITGYISATDVTLYNANGVTTSSSKTIQWGTSNSYFNTNQSGSFPNLSALSTNPIGIKSISAPNFTCDQCNVSNQNSDAYAVSLQAGATAGKPLGSYYSRTYTPSTTGGMDAMSGRGVFKSLRINVTTASVAAGSNTMSGNQFRWFMIDRSVPTAPAPYDWLPANLTINLKQVGDRVITPSGVTCNGSPGACSGDTINIPANLATMWIMNKPVGPYIAGAFTSPATFTMTLETDPLE